MKKLCLWTLLLTLLMLAGCSTINRSRSLTFPASVNWGIVPLTNNTSTPLAGKSAESITAALLRSKGMTHLTSYQHQQNYKNYLPGVQKPLTNKQILSWARKNRLRYIMAGSVNEWQYKVGIDGEPVVGVSLKIIDAQTGAIVWSAVGSDSGSSRKAVTYIAQNLISNLLSGIRLR